MQIGANLTNSDACEFRVWAPFVNDLNLKITSPETREIKMQKETDGYWSSRLQDISADTQYTFASKEFKEKPDPASFFQPKGVHGPSQVVQHASYKWSDSKWQGIPLEEMIIYELHVGTFTQEGTLKGITQKIDYFKRLGVNTIEIMPVAQFPGERNWGYDGVYPFAVQNSYGGPQGLKLFVDQCHQNGIAVILDVVYNHLGPEGNYLSCFGPYFTDKYKTPWGQAVNFDDAYCDGVRNYFIENAIYWFTHYHIDALRLDAVHGIYDFGAKHFLSELSERVEELSKNSGRKRYLIAESDLNDIKIIQKKESGGFGIDAQWCDDFHHSVHTLLTEEERGYYSDFGRIEDLSKCYREGFIYSGKYSSYRKRCYGNSSRQIPAERFVICTQNHDQVGNRMLGERLSSLVSFEALKLAAGAMFFSSYVPLLFMGQEYAEDSPFLYFISHGDEDLVNAVREGRKNEFRSFRWKQESPDPQSEETFLKSKLKWDKIHRNKHKIMFLFYKELIRLRRQISALRDLNKTNLEITKLPEGNILFLHRWHKEDNVFCFMNFSDSSVCFSGDIVNEICIRVLDSADKQWAGPGTVSSDVTAKGKEIKMQPKSLILYERKGVLS